MTEMTNRPPIEPVLVISNIEQLKKQFENYEVDNIDDLDDLLWYTYGVSLEITYPLKEKLKNMKI